MSSAAVSFESVGKTYPLYHHMTGGIKRFLFDFPGSLRALREEKFVALHDISFELGKGESLGIVGRNGAGKSTLLGLIAGVLRPSQGSVHVNGRVSPLLALGAGFHPDLNGRENILLNGVLMGLSRREVLRREEEIIAFAELDGFIDQPVRVYSSGMLARLGFSVIAHLDPQIMLIDEVLAVGDADFQQKCREKMQKFHNEGVTLILASHSKADLLAVCGKALWIENHSVRCLGSAERIVTEYFDRRKE